MSALASRDRSCVAVSTTSASRNDALIARQRAEIDELRERVRQLEKLLSPPLETPAEWKLTAAECRVFCALTTREWVSHEALIMAGRLFDDSEDDQLDRVLICRIRQKTIGTGVEIKSVHGRGYRLLDRHGWAKVLR